MTARVLVIALDAFESPVAERWAAEGLLPNLRQLIDGGASVALSSPMDTLPFGIWPEIASGINAARSGVIFHAHQIHTGEAVPRRTTVEERDPRGQFWAVASDAGRQVCVIDIPQSVSVPGLNGVQVYEWGIHDRHVEIRSEPQSVLEDVRARWGVYPVDDCDTHHRRTAAGYEQLLNDLLWGANAKAEWASELLQSEHWDLFTCCWSESHCIGHQLRHVGDPTSGGGADGDGTLADSWLAVYQRIDDGIGRLIAAAGPEATVVAVASHGMGPYIGGYQLLPLLLERLGFGPHVAPVVNARRLLPRSLRRAILRHTPRRATQRALGKVGVHGELNWLENPSSRAVPVQVGRVGAIRLNLVGRDPFGSVRAGPEAEQLLRELRSRLIELCLPGTDTRIVDEVFTSTEAFGGDHHPDVPDLMVVFRRDLGLIEAAESERVGVIRRYANHNHPRTGDHTAESRLWATGAGIRPGSWLPPADLLDVAPTVLDLLGVPTPPACDGRAIDLCAGSSASPDHWRVSRRRAHESAK